MFDTTIYPWAVVSKADGFVYGLYGTRAQAREHSFGPSCRIIKTTENDFEEGLGGQIFLEGYAPVEYEDAEWTHPTADQIEEALTELYNLLDERTKTMRKRAQQIAKADKLFQAAYLAA